MTNKTRQLTYTALFSAITFLMIYMIKIPIPNGYVHLGDAAVFLCGFILGPVYGVVAAVIGAGMADYFSGYAMYIIPTILAKGTMAFICGIFFRNPNYFFRNIIAMSLASLATVFIYYMSETILLGSLTAPLVNVPFNAVQAFVGMIFSLMLFKSLAPYRLVNPSLKDRTL